MNSPRQHILMEYAGLPNGATLSGQLCPSCNGGQGSEHSMSVGRTDGLLWWRCHRNKCDFRGMYGGKASASGLTKAEHVNGRWNYTTQPLSKAWLDWLSSRFSLLNELVDREWQWTDSYGGRVVMPIRNERGITTAYTLRSYSDPPEGGDIKQGFRKALIHRVMEQAGQAWYQSCPYPSHLIIVEDQPSALRASTFMGVNAIALTGTHIPEQLIDTIKYHYPHNPVVVVALDQDATAEAARQVITLRNNLSKLRLFSLNEDIKNMDEETFRTTMLAIKEMQ